jgi:Rad3-related DNA helicase
MMVNELCAALRIEVPLAELDNLLGMHPLRGDAPMEAWRNWADSALVRWGDEMDRLAGALRGNQYIDPEIVDEFKVLQNLGDSLGQVSMLSGDWVVGNSWNDSQLKFDPVWPTDYAEELLFRGAKQVLFLSATVVPKVLDIVGVTREEREYVEYPSTFPLRNRPFYILKSAPRVDFRMNEIDERLWIDLIDAFIGPRLERGRNGIIHCVSYARMERIKKLSKYRDRFITNANASETGEAIERFKKSRGRVLLSPSVQVGEDFPDDECRWIVIAKLPFSDSRDPVLARREADDPGYGGFTMITTLTQSAGRANRNVLDWCETIVIDGHAKWALPKFEVHAPKYFRNAWQWIHTLPEIMER